MEDKIIITQENKQELEAELKMRLGEKRKEIKDQLEFAKSLGDLSENAEYHQAREDQGRNEDRISEIEHLLQVAEVVTKAKSNVVDVGSTVTLLKKGEKTEQKFIIVGAEEADISEGKISYVSPIGSAIFGKAKGDTVIVNTPKGEVSYTVVKVG